MTIDPVSGAVPHFELHDRLRKAREYIGLDQIPFAADLGVSRQSITNWERGHTKPRPIVLKAWALRTGVSLEWLETGTENPRQGGPDGGLDVVRPKGFEPPTF